MEETGREAWGQEEKHAVEHRTLAQAQKRRQCSQGRGQGGDFCGGPGHACGLKSIYSARVLYSGEPGQTLEKQLK